MDTHCCKYPKTLTVVLLSSNVSKMTNSVDPHQTLGLHCLPRLLSVRKFRNITVEPSEELIEVKQELQYLF